jgi:methyl-accepting chemotaxis protein
MRSLFFKIFFCFWLSHLIVVSLLYVLITASQRERENQRENNPRVGPIATVTSANLTQYANQAAVKASNLQALTAYLKQVQKETGLRAALFDAKGTLIAGEARRESGTLVSQAVRSGQTEFAQMRGGVISAHSAVGPGGKNYVFTMTWGWRWSARNGLRGSSISVLGWRLDRGQTFEAVRLVAVFIAAGLVAFGLARYLTSPTIQLRRATRQLAAGDLSARVGPHMGRRRDEMADLGHDFDQMAERIEDLMLSQRRSLGNCSL